MGGIVCVGGALVDHKFHLEAPLVGGAPSLCGRAVAAYGGVARNVAENLSRLGLRPSLVSLVGDDDDGHALVRDLDRSGVETRWIECVEGASTARYFAVLDPGGECVLELADTNIFERFGVARLDDARPLLDAATWVFADSNLPADVLAGLAARSAGASFRLAVDAVALPKAAQLPARLEGVSVLFLNLGEAESYLRARHGASTAEDYAKAIRERGAAGVVLTDGSNGVVVAEHDVVRIPAAPVERVVDVTGAGDALVAATLAHLTEGDDLLSAVRAGTYAAARKINA